jgi:dTDP-4-amino-4,6-dideoxygalactose transaminase
MSARAREMLEALHPDVRPCSSRRRAHHALELSSARAGPPARGDEVVLPSFTFVSTANAFALRGVRLRFADHRSGDALPRSRLGGRAGDDRTRAIVPVHYAGVGADMDALGKIAADVGAAVVEDNAHGLFGSLRGTPLGTFGSLSTLSFHETKNISAGEGGALVVNDPSHVPSAEIAREKGTNRSQFFRGMVDKYTWVSLGRAGCRRSSPRRPCRRLEAATHVAAAAAWRCGTDTPASCASGPTRGGSPARFADDRVHPGHLFHLLLPDLQGAPGSSTT